MRRYRADKLIILFFVMLLFYGCARTTDAKYDNKSSLTNETITVVDSIGRKVAVPKKVERIGCLYAFSGHVTAMLGRGKDIVAVVNGLKRDILLNQLNPNIANAAVPIASSKINIEELISAKPDIVFIQGDTANDEGEIAKLEDSGIPYLVVEFNSIKEQQYAVEIIGKAIGEVDKAKKFNDFYQRTINRVSKIVKSIPNYEKVRIYHSVNEATRSDTKDSLPAEWTEIAGARNVSVGEDLKLIDNKNFASLEQILLWNPDVIFVNEDGVADYILSNNQWSSLNAVKNKKVFQLPQGISRWGHPGGLETPMAILWTAKILYPDKFKDVDMVSETKGFYQEFFNYKLNDDLAKKILSGRGMRTSK